MHNRVRIIGGIWRSRLINFPSQSTLRPTPDRVRETLFNWLGQDLSGLHCLDLFAGSGVFSFEALSRGAALAVCVELNRNAYRAILQNADLLKAANLEAHCADAFSFVRSEHRSFDVVFLDPPYQTILPVDWWSMIALRLKQGAFVYLEAAQQNNPSPGWQLLRHHKAGQVHYHLLTLREKAC